MIDSLTIGGITSACTPLLEYICISFNAAVRFRSFMNKKVFLSHFLRQIVFLLASDLNLRTGGESIY